MFFKTKNKYQPGLHDIGDPELDYWNVIEIANPELGTLIARLRLEKPPIPDIGLYSTAIEISWDYSSESPNMPTNETTTLMKEFQERIDDLCWYNNLSFNIQMVTGNGKKVWLFYTKSFDDFIKLFNKALSGTPELPLKIEYFSDPDWELWKEIQESVVEEKI